MADRPAGGFNHIAGGVAAAAALPLGVLWLQMPLLVALPIALCLYGGIAFALAPRRALDRIDPAKVGRAQAELVAGLIEESETVVARLRAAAASLRSGEARRTTLHMADIAASILKRLAADPAKLAPVRRFLTYYLPRSAEIAEGLAVIEKQHAPDQARLAAIGETLDKLDHAFTFYSDSFAQSELDALDVELRLIGRSLAEDIASPASGNTPQKKDS